MYAKEEQVSEGRGRRRHSAEFKARLIAECQRPGISVARIALDNGINANLLHGWIASARALTLPEIHHAAETFVPLQIHPHAAEPSPPIVVEVRRGAATVIVNWPIEAAGDCANWLRAWLR